MKYISLQNGVLFCTHQNYVWVALNSKVTICAADNDQLDGEIRIPGISEWTAVKNFDCNLDNVQAMWEE